jgi:transcriptional regulator with XRE-family HTH domain
LPELLLRSGKTQANLADYLEVSESFISQVIAGRAKFSVIKTKLAADFLGCMMEEVNEWIDLPDPESGKR